MYSTKIRAAALFCTVIALISLSSCVKEDGVNAYLASSKVTASSTECDTESTATSCTGSINCTTVAQYTLPAEKAHVPEGYSVFTGKGGSKAYFDDAVFLGDSRLDDFVMYMGLPHRTDYADTGLSVSSVYTKEFIEINGQKYTAMDALKKNKSFHKVYLMFGINEIGWPHPDIFIKDYEKIINDIREINSDAIICVQSVPPVTVKLDSESNEYKNDSIKALNEMIKDMAARKGVVFLDVASVLADKSGVLPDYAAADGMHMGKKLCRQWFDFLIENEIKRIS